MRTDTYVNALASLATWISITILAWHLPETHRQAGHAGLSEAIKGGDVVTVVTLSFQEAALGKRHSLQVGR